MNWYYADAGQQVGPIGEAELDALAQSGKIQPSTLVWRDGMKDWIPYAQIKAGGYPGGYTRGTDFVRAWRRGEGQSVSTNAFVPLVFELGEAFRFDRSEEGLVVGGIYYRMQVSHLKLCASRAF